MRNAIVLVAVVCCSFFCGIATAAEGENWPRFRGADGTGRSVDATLPVKWDATTLAWKTPLKGHGQSSPCVWGDRIFLTTALDDGKQRLVFCVDANNGKVLWEQVAWTGSPEKSHDMNGWATATCCTDGQYVIASFGKGGIHCYTAEGKHVWSRELGEFASASHRGTAASPVLAGDVVLLNGDSESDHALFGLNKVTGETVWKTDRPAWEGYSTPVPINVAGHTEFALNGDKFIAGYDPVSGKELWRCKSFKGRGEPLPAPGDGVLYVVNGLAGDMYAVKPGGTGDVTSTHMVWHTPRKGGRDGPSPLLVNGFLIVPNMAGIGACYEAATGKELWKTRLGGKISSSPISVANRAYLLFEDGETVVIEPGPEMKEIGRNVVGAGPNEIFRASPVPCHGHILLRSDTVLYCVGSGKAQANAGGARAGK